MIVVSPMLAESSGGFMDDFDFTIDAGLLDDIDFTDIFQKFDEHVVNLPDLEVDPGELLAEFSAFEEERTVPFDSSDENKVLVPSDKGEESFDKGALMEMMMRSDEDAKSSSSSSVEAESKKKKASVKSSHGKKKAKVDWTPELHRRFVQAVEQLGVDKAVPSRILELMGIDSLTRHNIASHLQKYRSHRKHLQAREAEAASWSQRRQIYATPGSSCGLKRDMNNSWLVPTMGFPPTPPPPPPAMQHFRPLHVWGHPSGESPMVPMWPPQHMGTPRTPIWGSHPPVIPPSGNPSFWHHPYARPQPHALNPGAPCVAVPMPTTRFSSPAVPGVLPHPMYRSMVPSPPAASSKNSATQIPIDAHPSNESIDAAIGDVLEKPWLPLPLGLKPPSTESVMSELQRQGISKVPPSSSSNSS